MMDKSYIQDNAILEQYVLGELNLSEQQKVELVMQTYPELKAELEQIELNFEKLGFENSIHPPSAVKLNLLKEIGTTTSSSQNSNQNPYRFYLGIAASFAALFLIGAIYLYDQLETAKIQFQMVQQQNDKLNENVDNLNARFSEVDNKYAAISSPNTEKYILKGNALMPEATIVSYVNTVEKLVFVNTSQLPELDAEHDYQMWADVEGEMINMGLIDNKKDLLAMNYIEHAESLNITIEPLGGSEHPDVTRLISNVYLK